MGTHPIFESDFDCLTEMARKKSATRRNKQFKSVDPFRKGKSTKGLGQDIGFNYGGDQIVEAPGNLKNILKKKKNWTRARKSQLCITFLNRANISPMQKFDSYKDQMRLLDNLKIECTMNVRMQSVLLNQQKVTML